MSSKIRCEKVKSEKRGVFVLFIILSYNFEKLIPFLIQTTLPNQTLESYILATIIADGCKICVKKERNGNKTVS